jgi:hypothetical protein
MELKPRGGISFSPAKPNRIRDRRFFLTSPTPRGFDLRVEPFLWRIAWAITSCRISQCVGGIRQLRGKWVWSSRGLGNNWRLRRDSGVDASVHQVIH